MVSRARSCVRHGRLGKSLAANPLRSSSEELAREVGGPLRSGWTYPNEIDYSHSSQTQP